MTLLEHYSSTMTALRAELAGGQRMTQEQRHAAYEMAGTLAQMLRDDPGFPDRLEAAASATRRGEAS